MADSDKNTTSAAASSDSKIVSSNLSTTEKLAIEVAKCIITKSLEGPYNNVEKSSGGDYLSIGVSCWEGGRADNILKQLGLSRYCGNGITYSGLSSADKKTIQDALGSKKGIEVQTAVLSKDCENYVEGIKSAIPSITNFRSIIYIGAWSPTSTVYARNHAKKNLSVVNDLAALNNWYINGDTCYALTTSNVGSGFVAGYATRGNKTYDYCMNLKESELGSLDLSTIQALQNETAIEARSGGTRAGSSSAATMSVRITDTSAHDKHTDITYSSPDKLYCEPVYPDLVAVNEVLPGCAVKEVMQQAKDSEVEEGANLTYTVPQETAAKYVNKGYATAIMANSVVAEQKSQAFNLDSFASVSKVPSSGKPPADKDPFPIDEKILELEQHMPRCKINSIKACPQAYTTAQACIKLSMTTEKRLVHLENIMATLLRYLARTAARYPVNCIYYGGTSNYERYKTIRCLKDNRLEDGQLMTFDQCMTCTRFSPLIGEVYEILNDEGLNLSEVLDECQLAYMTPEDYIKFDDPTKRQDPLNSAVLGVSTVNTRNSSDAAGDFPVKWTDDMGVKMDWSLVPVEDQQPSINGDVGNIDSNASTLTNQGTLMSGSTADNILTRQKPIMEAMTTADFGYNCVQSAKEWLNSHGDSYVANMNEYLFKNISQAVSDKKSSLDVLLVAAITCAAGKDAKAVIDDLEGIKSSLNAKNTTSLLLITQLYGMDEDNLFGSKGDGTDTAFRYRLDKVTKIVEDTTGGSESGSSVSEVGFNLNWDNRNEWNWNQYAEPLNINIKKDKKAASVDSSMELLPKIIYLYCLFRDKCNSSMYDDTVHGYVFPFRESDLHQVRYSADYADQRSYGYHSAIDLGADEGTDILAIYDGTVIHAESDGGAGNALALQHTDGIVSIYCHMKALEHKVGDHVSKGQIIGHVGHTGHCVPDGPDGAHLHLSMNTALSGSFRNNSFDPVSYFTRLNGKLGQFLA